MRIPDLSANFRRNLTGFTFVSPWLIGLCLLFVYPFAASLYWSFCRYDLLTPPEFIGTQHYQRLATEIVAGEGFGRAIWNTGYFALLSVPLSIALKPSTQLVEDPYALLPRHWQWSNYVEAVQAMPYLRFLRNTLLLAGGSVLGSVLSCALVAYGFARVRWRGRNQLFGVLIATMLLPWHVTMIPRFLLLRELGLYNSLAALVVPTFLGDAFFYLSFKAILSDNPRKTQRSRPTGWTWRLGNLLTNRDATEYACSDDGGAFSVHCILE